MSRCHTPLTIFHLDTPTHSAPVFLFLGSGYAFWLFVCFLHILSSLPSPSRPFILFCTLASRILDLSTLCFSAYAFMESLHYTLCTECFGLFTRFSFGYRSKSEHFQLIIPPSSCLDSYISLICKAAHSVCLFWIRALFNSCTPILYGR